MQDHKSAKLIEYVAAAISFALAGLLIYRTLNSDVVVLGFLGAFLIVLVGSRLIEVVLEGVAWALRFLGTAAGVSWPSWGQKMDASAQQRKDKQDEFEQQANALLSELSGADHAESKQERQRRYELKQQREQLHKMRDSLRESAAPADMTVAAILEIEDKLVAVEDELGRLATRHDGLSGQPLYDEALARCVDNPAIYVRRAAYFNDQGKHENARLDCNRALSMFPRYDAAYVERGYAMECCGDKKWALQDYKRSLKATPDNAVAMARLSSLYLKTGRYRKAVTIGTKLIAGYPDHSGSYGLKWLYDTHSVLAHAYENLKKYALAVNHLTTIVQFNPRWQRDLLYRRATLLAKQGSNELAISDLRQQIALHCQNEQTFALLMRLEPDHPDHFAAYPMFAVISDEEKLRYFLQALELYAEQLLTLSRERLHEYARILYFVASSFAKHLEPDHVITMLQQSAGLAFKVDDFELQARALLAGNCFSGHHKYCEHEVSFAYQLVDAARKLDSWYESDGPPVLKALDILVNSLLSAFEYEKAFLRAFEAIDSYEHTAMIGKAFSIAELQRTGPKKPAEAIEWIDRLYENRGTEGEKKYLIEWYYAECLAGWKELNDLPRAKFMAREVCDQCDGDSQLATLWAISEAMEAGRGYKEVERYIDDPMRIKIICEKGSETMKRLRLTTAA